MFISLEHECFTNPFGSLRCSLSALGPGEPLFLFSEYKATQALIFAALEDQFDKGCVGFINGDERLVVPSVATRTPGLILN